MLRRISYRTAANGFIFLGLWLVMGGLLVWSPIPGWLGIGSEMFVVWILLLFTILSVAGALLCAAALNGAFPPHTPRPQRRLEEAAAARADAVRQANAQGAQHHSHRG
jgi:hypothetical protein